MGDVQQYIFDASDRTYYSVIKKEIHTIAARIGFQPQRLGEIDLIVAEMVSNLGKYTKGGHLLVKPVIFDKIPGIEVICFDRGPGMVDTVKMMGDGYSSKNTLGHGLGSIKRFSDQFHIYSQNEWGTIIISRVYTKELPQPPKRPKVDIHALVLPKPGETACGDGFYAKSSKDSLKVFLGDGLGHGPEAAAAVQAAIEAFRICPDDSPSEIIRFIDHAVRKTRGLVATVAVFDFKAQVWKICGVGNIAARIQDSIEFKSHLSYNGIVGMNIPRTMNDQVIPFERNQHLILCSDGIKTKWDIQKWPLIFRQDLSILSTALYKDFTRGNDDVSVVICKVNP